MLVSDKFKRMFIQPAAGDAGGSLGAALIANFMYFESNYYSNNNDSFSTYLGPEYTHKDLINFNPAQVKRLHLLYQPVPEAVVDARNGYVWLPKKDTVDEGMGIKFAVDVRNISAFSMDSLLVNYWVEDANQQKKVENDSDAGAYSAHTFFSAKTVVCTFCTCA